MTQFPRHPSFLLFLLLMALLPASALAQLSPPDAITGKWYTPEKESIVEIYKENSAYSGRVIWAAEPFDRYGKPVTDTQNPDLSLRGRRVIGMAFMWGFFYEEGRWTGGKVYNMRDGKTYDAHMQLAGPNVLHLRGFIGFSLIGKTSVWERVK